jgi:hypothetical protein
MRNRNDREQVRDPSAPAHEPRGPSPLAPHDAARATPATRDSGPVASEPTPRSSQEPALAPREEPREAGRSGERPGEAPWGEHRRATYDDHDAPPRSPGDRELGRSRDDLAPEGWSRGPAAPRHAPIGGVGAQAGRGHGLPFSPGSSDPRNYPGRSPSAPPWSPWWGDGAHPRAASHGELPRRNRGPKGYKRSDERIREDVCDRLIEADVDASDVSVTVSDGEVLLVGTVGSRRAKHEIEMVSEVVPGVHDVQNQIRVRRHDEPHDAAASTPGPPAAPRSPAARSAGLPQGTSALIGARRPGTSS